MRHDSLLSLVSGVASKVEATRVTRDPVAAQKMQRVTNRDDLTRSLRGMSLCGGRWPRSSGTPEMFDKRAERFMRGSTSPFRLVRRVRESDVSKRMKRWNAVRETDAAVAVR
jgi:hypothetical protein